YIDDGAMMGNVFSELLDCLHMFFTRHQEQNLSISPMKTQMFMNEVIFVRAQVGREGIQPDLMKIAAVTEWLVPSNLLEWMHCLGL
ncbi:hypothetical protein BDR06DRAFT_848938, partial [Suillus hirtellus]